MFEPTIIDLTVVEGDPGLRAEILLELETDELAARRLRGQVRFGDHLFEPPSARRGNGMSRTTNQDGVLRHREHAGGHRPAPDGTAPLSPAVHRTMFAVDIEGSTKRSNAAKAQMRRAMYELLAAALRAAGLHDHVRDELVDRGDSALVLIPAVDEAPKTLLFDTVVPALTTLLAEHNARDPEAAFRLRVAIHDGELHNDGRGWFGYAIDLACRLLDAPEVKKRLAQADAPLVLVVSDSIYQSVVRQEYDGIDCASFEPSVRVRVGDDRCRGWVQVPERAEGSKVRRVVLDNVIEPEPAPASASASGIA